MQRLPNLSVTEFGLVDSLTQRRMGVHSSDAWRGNPTQWGCHFRRNPPTNGNHVNHFLKSVIALCDCSLERDGRLSVSYRM